MVWFSRKKDDPPSDNTPGTSEGRDGESTPKAVAEARANREALGQQANVGFLSRLTAGISKTRQNLVGQMRSLFEDSPTMDEEAFEELEHVLLSADCSVETTYGIVDQLRKAYQEDPSLTPESALGIIREDLSQRISKNYAPMNLNHEPFSVILVVGVNGVGKTTTIAKLAHIFKAYGKKIMLVAGDTFRAGAIEQLCAWGERLDIEVRRGKEGADPSGVVFDALQAAQTDGTDLVIIDTAGRLHTQVNLMEELKKVRRVIQKICPGAPHETFIVLDSTTGQNGLRQAEQFNEAMDLSGIVLTKLDGTAKGGIVIAVTEKLDVPIRFVGVGEKLDDLNAFRGQDYIEALFADGGVEA